MKNTKKEQGTLFRSFSFPILKIFRNIVYCNKTILKILYNYNKYYEKLRFRCLLSTKNKSQQNLEPLETTILDTATGMTTSCSSILNF